MKRQAKVKVKNLQSVEKLFALDLDKEAKRRGVEDRGELEMVVTIETPYKPRTTGYKSQNHALNGFIQQICMETGQDFDSTKTYIKQMAIERGYPIKTVHGKVCEDWWGNPIGISESEANTKECSLLIECAVQLAAELDIVLSIGEFLQ